MSRIIDSLLKRFDKVVEANVRSSARTFGRRSFLATTGTVLAGAAAGLPVLPFDRRANAAEPAEDMADPCGYWRHCAIDGFLCEQSGGTINTCPPGSSTSAVSWVGTCANPDPVATRLYQGRAQEPHGVQCWLGLIHCRSDLYEPLWPSDGDPAQHPPLYLQRDALLYQL